MDTIKPKNFTEYLTRCGLRAEVYRTAGKHFKSSTCCGQAIGSVLVPPHPASLAGWTETTWDAETGENNGNERWDLVEDFGPIVSTLELR